MHDRMMSLGDACGRLSNAGVARAGLCASLLQMEPEAVDFAQRLLAASMSEQEMLELPPRAGSWSCARGMGAATTGAGPRSNPAGRHPRGMKGSPPSGRTGQATSRQLSARYPEIGGGSSSPASPSSLATEGRRPPGRRASLHDSQRWGAMQSRSRRASTRATSSRPWRCGAAPCRGGRGARFGNQWHPSSRINCWRKESATVSRPRDSRRGRSISPARTSVQVRLTPRSPSSAESSGQRSWNATQRQPRTWPQLHSRFSSPRSPPN